LPPIQIIPEDEEEEEEGGGSPFGDDGRNETRGPDLQDEGIPQWQLHDERGKQTRR